MSKMKKGRDLKHWRSPKNAADAGKLRIIGGKFRGRQINYSGDPITRPMKDDIREAIFNLVGGWVSDKVVFDLFSGTGAVGLEAISRGASCGFLIERHFPTVRTIKENAALLDKDLPITVASSDTFFWCRKFFKNQSDWPSGPWLVFFCPPYHFYVEREAEVLQLIETFIENAPDESLFVVESNEKFDHKKLPTIESPDPQADPASNQWVTRQYSPAAVSVLKKNFPSDAVSGH